MRILLIAPHAEVTGYSSMFLQSDEINIGLLSIAASCNRQGHETTVVLSDPESTALHLAQHTPELVGISALTPTYLTALAIAEEVKRYDPDIITVLGGHHVSALPEEALSQESVDYVIRGEGENALAGLADTLEQGKTPQNIEGVCYCSDGSFINTDTKAVIENLDTLPFMDQDILENERVFIVSSRGCPYQCDFCSVGSFYRRRWRKRSVENILAELRFNREHREEQGATMSWVDFRDDNLTVDISRLEALCRAFRTDENLNFSWHCQTRVDTLTEHPGLIKTMKSSGCTITALGLESGLQEILDVYNKQISFEQSQSAAAQLTAAGILHIWYAMMGCGNELDTPDILRRNIEAIAAFPFDLLQISLLTPFPGTPVYERLAAEGRLLHRNWNLYDGLHCVYRPAGATPEQMEQILLWAYRKVFIQSGLKRIIHTLSKSRRFWGNTVKPGGLLRIARDMILLKRDIWDLEGK